MHKLEEVIAFLAHKGGEGDATKPIAVAGIRVKLTCHEVSERIGTVIAFVGGGVVLERQHKLIWVNFHDVITAEIQAKEVHRGYE